MIARLIAWAAKFKRRLSFITIAVCLVVFTAAMLALTAVDNLAMLTNATAVQDWEFGRLPHQSHKIPTLSLWRLPKTPYDSFHTALRLTASSSASCSRRLRRAVRVRSGLIYYLLTDRTRKGPDAA